MKDRKLLYATGSESTNTTDRSTRNDAELSKSIIDGLTVVGGAVKDIYDSATKAIVNGRQIIKGSIESFYNLDTNKNANLGYVIVLGIAIIGLLAYKIYKDNKH